MTDREQIEKQLREAQAQAEADFAAADSPQTLYEAKTKYLGKKGAVKAILRGLGGLSAEERPLIGQIANEVADALEIVYDARLDVLKRSESEAKLAQDSIDVSFPGTWPVRGARHPLALMLEEIEEFFYSMGYDIAEGPEIEQEWYNFDALNIPADHPARDMQDTFWMKNGGVLRTHTSPVQIRYMQSHQPPLRMIAPGRVYRCDSDVTHSPMFTQVEGLVVGEDVSFRHLIGTLEALLKHVFEDSIEIRLRPSFFPFTEPSAEVDLRRAGGDWMEVLGCGMVNPAVFESAGYDSSKVTGFAFGLGIERFAMIKYGIRDIRLFYENDVRFLRQFR
ncbi:MAG: phenylalanine--tRNA ligase subunit alpha [bacterium]|nr:phenylalanine--tRNA ligase subunit alpha [bacterium]